VPDKVIVQVAISSLLSAVNWIVKLPPVFVNVQTKFALLAPVTLYGKPVEVPPMPVTVKLSPASAPEEVQTPLTLNSTVPVATQPAGKLNVVEITCEAHEPVIPVPLHCGVPKKLYAVKLHPARQPLGHSEPKLIPPLRVHPETEICEKPTKLNEKKIKNR
jgi:hypothetical protein